MNKWDNRHSLMGDDGVRRCISCGQPIPEEPAWPDRASLIEIARAYVPAFDGLDSSRLDTLRSHILNYFGVR